MFAIVEFTETTEVAVVAADWILNDRECVWPPFKRSEALINAAKKSVPPTNTWGRFPIRIMKKFSTYKEAEANLSKAELTSDLSEAEKPVVRRRSSVAYTGSPNSQSSDSAEPSGECLTPRKRKKFIPGQSRKSLPPPPVFKPPTPETTRPIQPINRSLFIPSPSKVRLVSNEELIRNSYDSVGSSSAPERFANRQSQPSVSHSPPLVSDQSASPAPAYVTPNMQMISNSDNHEFRQYVVRSLQTIKTTLQQLTEAVTSLTLQSSRQTLNAEPIPVFNIPVNSLAEFNALSEQLQKNSDDIEKLTAHLAGVGGTDYKEATRRILRRIMGDNVAVLFSMLGRKKKMNFSITVLKNIVVGAVRQSINPKPTESEVETVISDWLKHAKKRNSKEDGSALSDNC